MGAPTVALVTANIHLGVGATLWSGVLDAAERNDVDLVCLPGDALRPGDGAPRNALYDLLSPDRVDGAICWASTLGLPARGIEGGHAARLVGRLARLGHVVSLNRAIDGHETLLLDTHAGMREAVGHLVRHHGRRRLACLRGPLSNPVSLERFRAYADALARHRLPRDRALVSASVDYAAGAGAAAMGVLLDVRGLRPGRDFDAVVACSDVLAADALRFLAGRGIRVPDDLALISFNDSTEARISDPPLTSVALPFAELGALAVDTLVARLRGTRPPDRRVVAGTLVTRRSCGCPSPLVTQGEETALPEREPPEGPALDAELRRAFDEPGVAFLTVLERHLGERVHTVEDATALDRALLRLREAGGAGQRRERLVGQARLMVGDKSHRLLEYERWTSEQQSRRLRELATALTTVTDTAALARALDRHLPGLGIREHRLALGPGADPLPPGGPGAAPRTTVLEPLHIGAEQLGFAAFEAADRRAAARHGALYRALGDQISAALKGVRLFTEVRHARDAAQRASRLKTRLLDNATDELRTPVEAILRHTRPGEPAHADASGLLRLIDDLLDLSRSEIDALDLSRRLIDPRPLLADTFRATVGGAPGDGRLDLPRRLPAVLADEARLRQIVVNLLTAAAGRGPAGPGVALVARVTPGHLTVRITHPELALDAHGDGDEELFQPFATGEPGARLGLAIARRLAVLHGGTVAPHRADAGAPGFHLTLPLPTPADPAGPGEPREPGDTLLVAAPGRALPPEIAALARAHGLRPHRLLPDDDLVALTAGAGPAAVAWDAVTATAQEWSAVRRLHGHQALRHTPFLLYGHPGQITGEGLDRALDALRPSGLAAPAVIADGTAAARDRLGRLLPGRPVRAAADGTAALALVAEERPGLLVVARVLPDMDGFDLVERLPGTPALMLSDQGFTAADARRAEPHPGLVLLGRDILTEPETARLLASLTERSARAADPAPVRHALAYIEQHYRNRLSRWQIAQAAGVSEDHLGRLFHRELGLTLWEYLTRVRIKRAKERLQRGDESVQTVARAVGFHDRAYFSRVFRRVTGMAPHAYRDVG
ncbi:substrate-binding domain-containing protein [Streptomyces sp. SBT349]|uniref:substrate-binding domain-containing protein n=1 Tax=Streptomyces sp. SBT349 TaxID=1580539 RepID=UPI00066E72FD|nr:substrate-binding domain-containing protein [Streptomyces sp. SBT349]